MNLASSSLQWAYEKDVLRASRGGHPVFSDTLDHIKNGICRLLAIDMEQFRHFVDIATSHGPLESLEETEVISSLRRAAERILPDAAGQPDLRLSNVLPVFGHSADTVFASALPETETVAVVGNAVAEIGWLVDRRTLAPPQGALVEYERDYFVGELSGTGYGNYLQQQAWRLEKGERYVKRLQTILMQRGISHGRAPRLLDVGSGYGFFRKAAELAGWEHAGLEASEHAARASEELFGFRTHVGTTDDLGSGSLGTFDVITLWDVIEHVPNPVQVLRDLRGCLREQGLLFLRTPNINALEREVFQRRYHSFKLEHLYYFGVASMHMLMSRAGLEIIHLATDSHLLRGLLGRVMGNMAAQHRGSDFFVAAAADLRS